MSRRAGDLPMGATSFLPAIVHQTVRNWAVPYFSKITIRQRSIIYVIGIRLDNAGYTLTQTHALQSS